MSEHRRANTIIAGANKAGTTSLFVSLSAHPDVAPASVKETRYFLPLRWGEPLEPVSVYESYFADAGDRPVRLEATPSYLYGGAPVVAAMQDLLDRPRILVVLREPVARLLSFFEFQKARLRIPDDLSIHDYLVAADRLDPADFARPENERWFGFRGGCYAEFLGPWHDAFGDDLKIVFFEDLTRRPDDVLADVAAWLGLDPARFPRRGLSSENRTTGFKHRGFQRVALAFNDRFEPFLRRHQGLKERLRAAYYRVNGRRTREAVPASVRADLQERYREPNARLRAQLRSWGVTLPAWLEDAEALSRPVPRPALRPEHVTSSHVTGG